MTYKQFNDIFLAKYPNGFTLNHGQEMARKSNSNCVVVCFDTTKRNYKIYKYYESYINVLNRVGIKTISKRQLKELRIRLQELIDQNGKTKKFVFGKNSSPVYNNAKEIAEIEKQIAEIEKNFIIV